MSRKGLTVKSHQNQRCLLLEHEKSRYFGADVLLTEAELAANEVLMDLKQKDIQKRTNEPQAFSCKFGVDDYRQSNIFTLISKLPKGGLLRCYDFALSNMEYIINLTHKPLLWGLQKKGCCTPQELRFSRREPILAKDAERDGLVWQRMCSLREEFGIETVNQALRKRLQMVGECENTDTAWKDYGNAVKLLQGLITFVPLWEENFAQGLAECYADGVQYLEVRSTLPKLYDLDGNTYTECEAVCFYKKALDKFMKSYPDFIGAKLIYMIPRTVGNLTDDIRICTELKKKYPDFFIGIDFFGQESNGRALKELLPQLLTMPENIDFFFMAGETNWNGHETDENLFDAIILGTKRIGQGVAILKHPLLLDKLKEKKIAIEVCPISNQVFNFVGDTRCHPAAFFFANNQPLVIASDSPLMYKTKPLSHDFYVAFMAIAALHADLRFLKKLSLNSINFSAMNLSQKTLALAKWQSSWDNYLQKVLSSKAVSPCKPKKAPTKENICCH